MTTEPTDEDIAEAAERLDDAKGDLKVELIERLVSMSELVKSHHVKGLLTRFKKERERALYLERLLEIAKIEIKVQRRVLEQVSKRAKAAGAPALPVMQAEALVTYHDEAWDEGRDAGQRILLAELEGCLVCRCITTDTDILNGVQAIVDAHKEKLGVG